MKSLLGAWLFFCFIFTGLAQANSNLYQAMNIEPLSAPKQAPAFKLEKLDGQQAQLSDYSGKLILLNFWATWCTPCRHEMPAMEKLWQKYQDQGFVMLGVSNDSERHKKRVKTFVRKMDLSFPILLDTESEVSDLYDVSGIPVSYLISPEGQLLAEIVGIREWASGEAFALVESLLQ